MKILMTTILMIGLSAGAQTSSSSSEAADSSATSKAKTQKLETKQADTKDIDNEITNAKMRAEAGSKSKHSFSLDMNYQGGSVKDVFGYNRPKLNAGAATSALTSLAGTVGYRYRLDANNSLSAGVGVAWITPGHKLKTEGVSQYQASDPYIAWGRSFKSGRFQASQGVTLTKITSQETISSEQMNMYLNASQTALTEIGTSGWQLGVIADFNYYNYLKYLPGEEGQGSDQTELDISLYPFAEYAFNDTYNFRTLYKGLMFAAGRDSRASFTRLEPTQSMGLGIAATRDIFLYPNIQWVWADMRAEKTNVALSATMNFM